MVEKQLTIKMMKLLTQNLDILEKMNELSKKYSSF